MSAATARIDTDALRHNLGQIRNRAPASKVMAVIKANAYGHGMVPVAHALTDVDSLAVARIGEAIQLRAAGVAGPIVVLEGVRNADELGLAGQHRLETVIHCPDQIMLLEQNSASGAGLWLKLDTGMNRLGFAAEEFRDAHRRLVKLPSIGRNPGLMSHFSSADVAGSATSQAQLKKFLETTAGLPGERSIANSAGILNIPASHLEWVRPGLCLYGVSPVAGKTGHDLGLRPVMRFSTWLVATRNLVAGDTVGYGCRWRAAKPTRLGIAACGYGDGYPWALPEGTPLRVNGMHARLAGRVSMDMIAIDLGADSDARIGHEVLLWGETELPVEEIAAAAQTIPYELLCRVSERVSREIAAARAPIR
ncbi:MAG: alanine racemase [Proteobacteria bacterium]|nr:alanine racemase [Pseudomonadota bacterium]